MKMIECACGCGEMRTEYGKWGNKRRYINHHNRPYEAMSEKCAKLRSKRECPNCKRLFEILPCKAGKKYPKYCGQDCYLEVLQSGEYFRGKKWPQIRKQTMRKDDWTCQLCDERGGRLNVHHIVPWRVVSMTFPCSLITLCSPCHASAEMRYRKGLPYKKPYPGIREDFIAWFANG